MNANSYEPDEEYSLEEGIAQEMTQQFLRYPLENEALKRVSIHSGRVAASTISISIITPFTTNCQFKIGHSNSKRFTSKPLKSKFSHNQKNCQNLQTRQMIELHAEHQQPQNCFQTDCIW
jgi:hypothetical protein